jgi:hypothetical protein
MYVATKWNFVHPFSKFGKRLCHYLSTLPVQFKSLLHGQEGRVFFSGHLNVRKYQYVLVRLGRQAAFKSGTL